MKQIGEYLGGTGIDPRMWARRPQSQTAIDVIFNEAKTCPTFAGIRDRLIADDVCSETGRVNLVWSFAAGRFVKPAWYVLANSERAA